jgi:hypothetical protein
MSDKTELQTEISATHGLSSTEGAMLKRLVINAEAPTVKKIWISQNIDRSELRIDWSNDRHQAIFLKGDDPKSIAHGLEEMARLLHMEIYNKHL